MSFILDLKVVKIKLKKKGLVESASEEKAKKIVNEAIEICDALGY